MGLLRSRREQRAVFHSAGFAQDSSGTSAIEYALVLGILIGGAILGSSFLGISAQEVPSQVSSNLQGTSGAVANSQAAPVSIPSWLELALTAVVAFAMGYAVFFFHHRHRALVPLTERQSGTEPDCALELPFQLFVKRQQLLHLLNAHMSAVLKEQLQVRHLMSQRLTVVDPGTRAEEVRQRMETEKIRHLLVCHKEGQLLGIISDRDVRSRPGRTAAEMMTARPMTVSPDMPVSPAVSIMINKSFSCLPVVENGQLHGILTTTDLMLALQCNLQLVQRLNDALQSGPQSIEACSPPECEAAAV